MEIIPKPFRAPEIYGDFWFNTDPLSIGGLQGSVVLVDFWDYTAPAWLRTLPYLQEWHRRYADMGLVILGVHSPRFPFGKDVAAVGKAIERLQIRYPVVMDNEFLVWNAFRSRVWPTKFLLDKNGFIRYFQESEGFYQHLEHAIQSLLAEAGYRGEFPLIMEPARISDLPGTLSYRATPEILAGYQRGTIGNAEGVVPEVASDYRDPGYYVEGRLYLHATWFCDRNFVRLDELGGDEGYLVIRYQAREVSMVIKPEGERNFQVFVSQDGVYLSPAVAGEDVRIDADGRSYVLITEPRLYNIVNNPEFGEHVVKVASRSPGFALYAVSFVSSVIPDLVFDN